MKSDYVKQRQHASAGILAARLAIVFGLVCLVATMVMLAG